jgi:hypothetical protein
MFHRVALKQRVCSRNRRAAAVLGAAQLQVLHRCSSFFPTDVIQTPGNCRLGDRLLSRKSHQTPLGCADPVAIACDARRCEPDTE